MSNEAKPCVLLVDDEEGILKSLKRALVEVEAEFILATSGQAALDMLKERTVALIISDQRMPGMEGVEFLGRSREMAPDAIRILLTGYADIDATVEAINSGAVRYYMTKPWDDAILVSRILESLELYRTNAENKRLQLLTKEQNMKLETFNERLQQQVNEQTEQITKQHKELKTSFMDTIKAFSTLTGLKHKPVAAHSQRTATLAKLFLKGLIMSEAEGLDVVVAAYLHDIGKIGLPDSIATKPINQCSPHEKEMFYRHPVLGQSCLLGIAGFEQIGTIIKHHHENYDGTGYPDCLIGDKIPMGSRILRICDAFDHTALKDEYPDLKTLKRACSILHKFAGSHFDPELVDIFISLEIAGQFYHDDSQGIVGLKPQALKEGMVIAADIRTVNDVFLMPKGAKLSSGMIERIRKIHSADSIIEAIRVYKQSTPKEKNHVPAQSIIG